jgi:lauroyl/myristoyl acyltransferase
MRFTPRLCRVGRINLGIAYPQQLSRREMNRILRRSFQSFSRLLLDTFWFSRHTDERIQTYVRFDPSFDCLFHTKAHVCVTAHYGNWEVMGMAVTARGFPLHSVAKPLKNPEVDQLFIEARLKNGQKIVRRDGAVRTLMRVLKEDGKIALVMDQNTTIKEGGLFVPFFGLPVLVSSAAAALALKTRTDIFIGMMTPQPDGTYLGGHGREIAVADYASLPPDEAILRLTERITRETETIIRHHPEYWLWFYKRWKYVPAGDDPSRFPYYSRPAV